MTRTLLWRVAALMFIVPSSLKEFKFLLHWRDTEKLAWGILILFGGGLCLAQGLSSAGIIQAAGAAIAQQSPSVNWLLLGLITTSVFLTELMSNVALIQIFIPVVFGITANLGLNPILTWNAYYFWSQHGFHVSGGYTTQCHCILQRSHEGERHDACRYCHEPDFCSHYLLVC
jgi:di/tricarboxylate transporter